MAKGSYRIEVGPVTYQAASSEPSSRAAAGG